MNILTWAQSTGRGSAAYNNVAFGIDTKPVLSFEYDGLYYEDIRQQFVLNNVWTNLTDTQISEIETFIANAYNTSQSLVLGINAQGMYIGRVQPHEAAATVPFSPPTNDYWLWKDDTKEWKLIYGVDANGFYIGNVPTTDSRFAAAVEMPPPIAIPKWDFATKQWVDGRTLDQFRADKLTEINRACDIEVSTLKATYPDTEVQSWDKQEREAVAAKADATASTPLLDAIAQGRGVDRLVLADRIISKAIAFAQYSGALIGKRQSLEDQINAAQTPDEVNVIKW